MRTSPRRPREERPSESTDRFLDVSFENGRPLAAYLYLRDQPGTSACSEERGLGVVVDFGADKRPIGVEIIDPQAVTLGELNRVLAEVGEPPATEAEVRPLRVA